MKASKLCCWGIDLWRGLACGTHARPTAPSSQSLSGMLNARHTPDPRQTHTRSTPDPRPQEAGPAHVRSSHDVLQTEGQRVEDRPTVHLRMRGNGFLKDLCARLCPCEALAGWARGGPWGSVGGVRGEGRQWQFKRCSCRLWHALGCRFFLPGGVLGNKSEIFGSEFGPRDPSRCVGLALLCVVLAARDLGSGFVSRHLMGS
jgi:hypothetical protein